MQTVGAYYTIYCGFKKYRYNAKPPGDSRRKVAKKLGIPHNNIDVGVSADWPMWSSDKHNRILLWIGRIILVYDSKRG